LLLSEELDLMKGALLYGKIDGSEISIHVTEKAMSFLEKTGKPIYVGMELYFTYFMRKKVRFYNEKPDRELTKITDNLFLYFSPIQTRRCKIGDLKGDNSDLIEVPVTRKGALIPKYIRIDRKKDSWKGDFTWKSGTEELNPLILNYN
jgi:hypothetical protein